MAVLEQSRASLKSFMSTERHDMAEMVLSIAGVSKGYRRIGTDVRIDRVIALRRTIAEGRYFASATDLATKLIGAMRDSPSPGRCEDMEPWRDVPCWGDLAFHGFPHATFRASQASETAEERNDERVGKVDRNRWT